MMLFIQVFYILLYVYNIHFYIENININAFPRARNSDQIHEAPRKHFRSLDRITNRTIKASEKEGFSRSFSAPSLKSAAHDACFLTKLLVF